MTTCVGPPSLAVRSNREFFAKAESGELPIQDHKQLVRFTFICMSDLLFVDSVFRAVEKLHCHGWTFGQGELKFNRSLDIFYFSLVASIICRFNDQFRDDNIDLNADFDQFYARYHDMVAPDVWKEYYTPAFLHQASSARYYRLPNLRDIPDWNGGFMVPRPHRGVGHFTKLSRWAYCVARTAIRQQTLPLDTLIEIALSTFHDTISRQREEDPHDPSVVTPFSETQARFWLKRLRAYPRDNKYDLKKIAWSPYYAGMQIACGSWDVWEWEAHYSPKAWNESVNTPFLFVEPDRDGTREPEVPYSGWPEGGIGGYAAELGWEPELGSQEEMEFMAAVAAKETERIEMDELNYAVRSHLLLGVLHAAFCEPGSADREGKIRNLTRNIIMTERIEEDGEAEEWVRQALKVMEGYVQERTWPPTAEERSEVLRRILVDNGQLFGRCNVYSKEFDFTLKAPKGIPTRLY